MQTAVTWRGGYIEGTYNLVTERSRERHIRYDIQRIAVYLGVEELYRYPSVPSRRANHMSASLKAHPQNTNLVVFPDFADERVESLVDIGRVFGGCFHEACASEVLCQITALCITDQPVHTSYSRSTNGIVGAGARAP